MVRNFEFHIAANLTNSVDEFAYEHYMGALYYLRAARSLANTWDVALLGWFDALEACIVAAMDADHAAAEAARDLDYEDAMREYELGW